jgi:hypothetical protein
MSKLSFSALLMAGAMALTVVPGAALAQQASKASTYKAPRASDGKADLQGNWSNAYITPLERAATYGERRALTTEEAAQLEGSAVARFEEGNKPTDPNIGAEDHTSKNCQGAGGLDCGYNSGWKDSGTQVARVNGEPRTSFITSPANGRLPPTLGGASNRGRRGPAVASNEGREDGPAGPRSMNDNPETRSIGERCLMSFGSSAGPIMLPLMYNNTYQIVQNKDHVAILVEMVHDVRVVRLNAKHRTDGVRPWMGDSIGWWDGDTLVVETTNYHPLQSLRGSSENLKVTEKFTRVGPNRLLYQFTAEDPTVWAQPWGGEYEFMTANGGVYEYACHEGNYGLEGILAGAREEERQAAAGGTQSAAQ